MAKSTRKSNGAATTTARRASRISHPPHRNGNGEAGAPAPVAQRLPVLKTYKIFIGGKFPLTESGRYYPLKNATGEPIANMCLASRKDFREAVLAARAAQGGWAKRSAYNRAQILYRIAEMLEGRAAQFVAELTTLGMPASAGMKEVQTSIDRVLYYAGWADKFQQVFSSVNPVS